MKKSFLILLFVVIFCVCLSSFCIILINYVKIHNLLENGVFLNNLSEKKRVAMLVRLCLLNAFSVLRFYLQSLMVV